MKRRTWVSTGVAVAAGLLGAGVAWQRYRPHDVAPGAEDAWWTLQFERPDGGQPLAMRDFRGQPLLVNFWATWCPPCVDELPLLNRFYGERKAQGWQLLAVALDQPDAVRRFLQKIPLDFPVVMAGLGGTELGKSLGNTNGGLPFTVVFDAKGGIAQRKLGQVTPEDLAQWANSI